MESRVKKIGCVGHDCDECKKRKSKKKELAVLTRKTGWQGGETETFEVEVMVRNGAYAMVRRKGCMPFVAPNKDLTPNVI